MNQWNPADPEVAFSGDTMLSYAGPWIKDIAWKKVQPFEAVMRVVDYERGRSSAVFWLEDVDTGIKYPVSFAKWYDMFQASHWRKDGRCLDRWSFSFKKIGQNYFIIPEEIV